MLPTTIAAALVIVAASSGSAWAADEPTQKAEAARVHAAGARGGLQNRESVPEGSFLPMNAIDTTEIPDVVLEADAPDNLTLPYYRIGEATYFLFGNIAHLDEKNRGWNGNAGFIVTAQGVIVIDTLGTPKLGRRLIATIASVTDAPIRYVIVTHNHPDHAYGAGAFQQLEGVTIIAHAGTADYTHSAEMQRSVAYRRELLPRDMQGFEPLQADRYIRGERFGKARIQLGDQRLDIYNSGKHHSYGDLVVHQVDEKILWISDLAFNQRTTYMGDGDSLQILEAQDWMMRSFPDIALMVPGHGSVQSPPFSMVARTHDYVERMREAMRSAVDNGVSLLDATEQVEFDDWKGARLYQSNQRANANFVYREMEQAYFGE
jgi:glyoxylase-like metal-dependent hydrolase (beta-lactamase superfamily II)